MEKPIEMITFRCTKDLKQALDKQAIKENRPLSNMARHAVVEYLERVRQAEELVRKERAALMGRASG